MGSRSPVRAGSIRQGRPRGSRNDDPDALPLESGGDDPQSTPTPRPPRRAEAPADVPDPAEYWGRADRRRRHSRDLADEVLRRAPSLPDCDAALLRAVYADHADLSELAALTRTNVRALRRRLSQLVHRAMSDEFAFVAQRARTWPDTRRRVAEAVFLGGLSYRRAGDELGLSLHCVRQHCATIAAMCENAKQLAAELAAHGFPDRGGILHA